MASNKLSATVILMFLLCYTIFSAVCDPCQPIPKPKPKPKPKSKPEPKPKPKPEIMPSPPKYCPKDTLKLGACSDLLGGVVNLVLGTPLSSKCCALLDGLADLEVALCLCTAIKANVLGINLNVPITLSALVSSCQKTLPPGFQCE